MAKEHKIKTVQDMINCTNEDNLDNFLTDLRGYLSTAHMLKSFAELVGETKEQKEIGTDGFTWIDDGKHDATISVGVKKQNNN
jgi:hypothetical protein